jgi:hypothetical protein
MCLTIPSLSMTWVIRVALTYGFQPEQIQATIQDKLAGFLQTRLEGGEWVLHEALGFWFREADFRESPPA